MPDLNSGIQFGHTLEKKSRKMVSWSNILQRKKKMDWFLTLKKWLENPNFATFNTKIQTRHWFANNLESAIYHSINIGFDAEVAEKFLNGIQFTHTYQEQCNVYLRAQW